MTSLWLSIAALLVVAVIFISWPLLRYRKASKSPALNEDEINFRLTENVRIFREHLSELENSFSSQASSVVSLRVNLITADNTFGGGLNTPAFTVNKYSTL